MIADSAEPRTQIADTLRLARRLTRIGRSRDAVALLGPLLKDPCCPLGYMTFIARRALAENDSLRLRRLLPLITAQPTRSTTLHVAAGRARLLCRDLHGAQGDADAASILSTDRTDVRLLQLLCSLAAGDLTDAQRRFDTLASQSRLSPRLKIILASCAEALDRVEAGLHLITGLVRPPRLLLARLLTASDRWGEALQVLAAVCDTPHTHDLHELEPGVTDGVDDDQKAAATRRAAVARIDLLERIGDSPTLDALASRWLVDGDCDTVALVRLAEAMLAVGRSTVAARLALRTLKIHSRHPTAVAVLLAVAFVRNRPLLAQTCGEALLPVHARLVGRLMRKACLGQLLRPDPRQAQPAAHPFLIHRLLLRTQRVFSGSLRTHPSFADYRYHRAMCLTHLGRENDARVELREALAINPTYQNALRLQQSLTRSRRAA